jgi:hypothetical protein
MLPSAPETSLNSKCRKGRAYAEIVSSIFSPRPAGDAGRTEKGKPRRAQLRWSLVNMKKSGRSDTVATCSRCGHNFLHLPDIIHRVCDLGGESQKQIRRLIDPRATIPWPCTSDSDRKQ